MIRWLTARLCDRLLRDAERGCLARWRQELAGGLRGDVLEVGAGTGLILGHYPAAVTRLVVTEPDRHMRGQLVERLRGRPFLEHVADEVHPAARRWQRRIEPLGKHLAGNCHLTRRTEAAIRAAGFELPAVVREPICHAPPWARAGIRGVATKPAADTS